MTELRKSAFLECVQKNLSEDAREGSNIGTYKEKRLHRILKEFYEADLSHHEIKIGNYIADVLIENEIIEIQTGSFYPMVDKLRYYLENTDYKIRVVRPLPYIKWCIWLNKETGEIESIRRSGKKFLPAHTMRDWLFLSEFLGNDRLTIEFLLLEEEEYRFLDGYGRDKKKGSSRYERIPVSLIDKRTYSKASDYLEFLPEGLPSPFKASEYMKITKMRSFEAYAALNILCSLSYLRKEKEGRVNLFYKSK